MDKQKLSDILSEFYYLKIDHNEAMDLIINLETSTNSDQDNIKSPFPTEGQVNTIKKDITEKELDELDDMIREEEDLIKQKDINKKLLLVIEKLIF